MHIPGAVCRTRRECRETGFPGTRHAPPAGQHLSFLRPGSPDQSRRLRVAAAGLSLLAQVTGRDESSGGQAFPARTRERPPFARMLRRYVTERIGGHARTAWQNSAGGLYPWAFM